jgi:tRNA dimethylallyltransferase
VVQSIILTGPTAVGKSSLAIEVAKRANLEIVNADSVCFYKDFDIGSAKPSAREMHEVPHHLIDLVEPDDTYHAGRFLKDLEHTLREIHSRGKRAIIVGGSSFYLKALRYGLWEAPETSPEFRVSVADKTLPELFAELTKVDPKHAEKIGSNDRYRIIRALEIYTLSRKKPSELQAEMNTTPNPHYELWVVDRDSTQLEARMKARIQVMIDEGIVEETKAIREKYPDSKTLHAVGYAQVLNYLDGITPQGRKLKPGIPGLIEEISLSHRQLAKTQRTWLKNLNPNESFILDADRQALIEKLMNFYQ